MAAFFKTRKRGNTFKTPKDNMNQKRWIVAGVAVLALLLVAFGRIGAKTVVSTMHATTNYFTVLLGSHADSQVRLMSPSDAIAVQNTVILPRTNLAGVRIGAGGPYSFAPQTNALAGAGTTNLVIDGGQAALVRCVVGAAFGVLFTNLIDGQEGRIEIEQDNTGIRTGVFPYAIGAGGAFTNVYFGRFHTGVTFGTNANSVDFLKWFCRGTNVQVFWGESESLIP